MEESFSYDIEKTDEYIFIFHPKQNARSKMEYLPFTPAALQRFFFLINSLESF